MPHDRKKNMKTLLKTSSDIARSNNWKVNDILIGTEDERKQLIVKITAIGKRFVLGSFFENGIEQLDEVRIPLNDNFITWEKFKNG